MSQSPEPPPFIPTTVSSQSGVNRYKQPGCGLILFCLVLAWVIEIVDHVPLVNLDALGLRPRSLSGLLGVFTMPWLHGGFGHLISNSLAFVVLGYLVVATEKHRFYRTTLMIIVISGLGTWLIGRPNSVHIGASALIYGYFGYLVTRAFLERRPLWILLGIVLVIFYGGMIWGMMPTGKAISWEGHLMGFVAGLWMARRNHQRQRSAAVTLPQG